MQAETYNLTIETGENREYTARLGTCTGVGATRETAFTQLAQRIEGLTKAERNTFWASHGGGGEQARTAG